MYIVKCIIILVRFLQITVYNNINSDLAISLCWWNLANTNDIYILVRYLQKTAYNNNMWFKRYMPLIFDEAFSAAECSPIGMIT